MKPLGRIMLVEDDAVLGALVQRHLFDAGYYVVWHHDGEVAGKSFADDHPDLVILDVMLPGEDGLSLCRRLRKDHDVAIIMVTARGQEADRIRGLLQGADDYLPKPFSLWELEARIKAILRRYHRDAAGSFSHRDYGSLHLDMDQRKAMLDGRPIDLTRSEFDLLAHLTAEPGRVYSREQLMDSVQGGATDAFDRAIDTHISNLRRKIGDDPRKPRMLKTVWGVGYRFEGSS